MLMLVIVVLVLAIVVYFVYQYWKYKAADHGAPFVTLDQDLVELILQTVKADKEDIVYDLGSGDGRIPLTAGLLFGSKAVGIEIDKIRYFYSLYKRFMMGLSDRVTFLNQNIFNVNLSEATIVFMYLLQETNEVLADKLVKELHPGTIIVSAAFNFPNWKPVFVDHEHQTPFGPISYYEIGKSNKV